jgi:hypothetical protein
MICSLTLRFLSKRFSEIAELVRDAAKEAHQE